MPPTKLAHLVFQTNRLPAMRDWYCTVLDGRVIYENPHLSFVTYDDEHHRVAFVDFGPLRPRTTDAELGPKPTEQPGLHHVAYRVDSVDDALAALSKAGMRLIDEQPRTGIRNSRVAFVHPSSTGGVLTEIVQPAGDH